MAASENALGALHEAVARALAVAMEGTVVPGYTDPETGEEFPERTIPPSAAEIAAATKFLKDNNITCVPTKDNALGELEEKMRQRAERRKAKSIDYEAAADDMRFLGGLPN